MVSTNLGLSEKTTVGITKQKEELRRSLQARHMNMIAIGGAIGTGLFLASGGSLASAGPGGAVMAFAITGIMVYFTMTSLGEMATYMPISGSFETYATRFIDPALGFALGWNYWLSWASVLAVEMIAGAMIMKYWFPDTPASLWSGIFLILLFGLNMLSTRAYGESEYWFAGIKVVTCVVFLLVGLGLIMGLGGKAPGFSNWVIGDAPFVSGFGGFFSVLMIAGFSFQGTEMVGIAAGESENPEKNVPKAISNVFWRIMLFYVGSLIVIGFLLPYTDENLVKSGIDNVAVSPFTLVFEHAGFAVAASVLNAVLLTAVLSCANSGLYASTRMLYAMAKEGKAPAVLGQVNSRGVPANALIFTTIFGLGCFLTSFVGEGTAYIWLLNITGVIGFIAWLGIGLVHYRFRKAFVAQGKDLGMLKYKALCFPFGPIFTVALCAVVILGQNYNAFIGKIDWTGAAASYIGIPFFLILWLGYKYTKKTKVIPLMEVDLSPAVAYKKDGNLLD